MNFFLRMRKNLRIEERTEVCVTGYPRVSFDVSACPRASVIYSNMSQYDTVSYIG